MLLYGFFGVESDTGDTLPETLSIQDVRDLLQHVWNPLRDFQNFGKILSPNTLRSQFDAARKQTGRSLRGIPELHTHTLRATHGNRFSINSPNEKIALMGTRRAKSDVLIDRYQRANANEIREAQQKTYSSKRRLAPSVARCSATIRQENVRVSATQKPATA